MKLLRSLFRITPFKLSLTITLMFLAVSMVYDINPKIAPLIGAIVEKGLDYKFQIRGMQKAKSKIVIVAGDEKSFQTFGQWPFDRATVFAPLLENLCKYNPKAVGLDIVWSETEKLVPGGVKTALASALGPKASQLDDILHQNSGDTVLQKALQTCGSRVVMGYALREDEDEGKASKAEFERRLKILLDERHNTATTISKGRMKYPKFHGDPDANISFPYVAHSGLLNSPTVSPAKVSQGFFNNDHDSDGNYRHAQFFYRMGDSFVSSLAMRMAQKYFSPNDTPPMIQIQPYSPEQNSSEELRLELDTVGGKRRVPMDLYGQAIVNYRGPNQTFPNVSMADVLNPSETIEYDLMEPGVGLKHYKVHKTDFFKDALILVGITAQGLYDIRPRPFDAQASGIENHANILDNLLNDDFLSRPTAEMLAMLLLGLLAASLVYGYLLSKFDAKWEAVTAVVTMGGLLYFDQVYLFNRHNIVFSGQLQAIQFLFQFVAITVFKFMAEENEKKFIRSAFDKYVSPAVINSMLSDPTKLKLGGDKKELSILFSDIAGFTELSERVDVKTLTQFLNEYLGGMTEILQANFGTLDKYIGDAVMGFWGAPIDLPNHAELAVKTAIEMQAKLVELNAQFKQKYDLTIEVRIGINSGPVSVGNFGSSKVFEYTVIGDNVNLASRLEGINKYYGTYIMISETTYAKLPPNKFLCREVDTVKVKGKHKPVKIYEVFPDNAAHEPLKDSLKDFNEGLAHYYARRWDQAINFFRNVLKRRDGDKATLEFIERCQHYINNPPAQDWDGSWEMHSK